MSSDNSELGLVKAELSRFHYRVMTNSLGCLRCMTHKDTIFEMLMMIKHGVEKQDRERVRKRQWEEILRISLVLLPELTATVSS